MAWLGSFGKKGPRAAFAHPSARFRLLFATLADPKRKVKEFLPLGSR